jgi:predicted transcriptional regulator
MLPLLMNYSAVGEFEIAREIIRLRKKAKITQKQLAEMAGTSKPLIFNLFV